MSWKAVSRLACLAAALLLPGNLAAAEALRAGGIGPAGKMLQELLAAFDRGQPARADGVLDFAISARPLTREELAQGLTTAATVRTPFVLVTSHQQTHGLRRSEIAGILRAPRATWADGVQIRVILRPRVDGDTAVLGGLSPGMAAAIEEARQRPDVPIAATDQDNADLAEKVPGSLAGATLTQMKTERRRLRLLALDGIEPSLENLQSGAYPYARTLHLVLPASRSAAAERFVAFLHSEAGQAALRAAGSLLVE